MGFRLITLALASCLALAAGGWPCAAMLAAGPADSSHGCCDESANPHSEESSCEARCAVADSLFKAIDSPTVDKQETVVGIVSSAAVPDSSSSARSRPRSDRQFPRNEPTPPLFVLHAAFLI